MANLAKMVRQARGQVRQIEDTFEEMRANGEECIPWSALDIALVEWMTGAAVDLRDGSVQPVEDEPLRIPIVGVLSAKARITFPEPVR